MVHSVPICVQCFKLSRHKWPKWRCFLFFCTFRIFRFCLTFPQLLFVFHQLHKSQLNDDDNNWKRLSKVLDNGIKAQTKTDSRDHYLMFKKWENNVWHKSWLNLLFSVVQLSFHFIFVYIWVPWSYLSCIFIHLACKDFNIVVVVPMQWRSLEKSYHLLHLCRVDDSHRSLFAFHLILYTRFANIIYIVILFVSTSWLVGQELNTLIVSTICQFTFEIIIISSVWPNCLLCFCLCVDTPKS